MLHQLDLFGGEPVKIGDKPLPAHKRAAKKSVQEEAPIPEKPLLQLEDTPNVEEPIPKQEVETHTDKPIERLEEPVVSKPNPTKEKQKHITVSHEDLLKGQSGVIAIPEDEVLYSKQYYPISEVAKMFQVNVSLLRYWEKEFDIIKPRKNRKGDRLFRPEDIKNIRLIHFLLKEKKYTIKGAIHFLKNGKKIEEKFEAVEILKKIRAMLVDLKSGLS